MRVRIFLLSFLIIIVSSFYLSSASVYAQSEIPSPYGRLVDALNRETDEVYKPYGELIKEIETASNTENLIARFKVGISSWEKVFLETEPIYRSYTESTDSKLAEIAVKGALSNQKGREFLKFYRQGLSEDDESVRSNLLGQGDSTFNEAINYHDQAVGLYNDYSGASSSVTTKDFLIVASIISSVATFLLFLKSRNTSSIRAEIIKSEIYKRLTRSAIWMTVGLVVTTVGFAYALNNGGSYYIFWGPVVFGGWELLKGLSNYFRNDRKVLAVLATEQRGGAIRQSFGGDEVVHVRKIKCPNCGRKQSKQSIVCSYCGTNLL